MRIIHAADLHLGSKIEAKLKPISDDRKMAVRNSFMNLAEYARKNDIHVILLAGDVFDSDTPFKKDKDTFYSVIEQHPDIDFLYLRGNHDTEEDNAKEFKNLKTFSDKEWISYEYDDVVISGIELTKGNSTSFYSTLNLNPNKVNIVMLHGQISDSVGYEKIKISQLKEKNIDYLALGHIHSYSEGRIDSRGTYAYSGCLEGRGFDEAGEKGFVLLDVGNNKITHSFIPFSSRTIRIEEMDVSGLSTIPEVLKKVQDTVKFKKNDIYRIELVGDVPFDADFDENDIQSRLSNLAFFVNVKKKTLPLIDPSKFVNDLSLKGEFVRTVYANDKLSEEEKRKVVSLGLNALEGRNIDL